MKQTTLVIAAFAGLATVLFFPTSCASRAEEKPASALEVSQEPTKGELLERGKYLVTIGGCHDCHTAKIFGPNGPSLDEAHLLAGHVAGSPLPPIDAKSLQPGNWLSFSGDVTAYVGPWGMSYSANLTPDSATGIGAWSEEVFVKTLRTGKHLGQEGGRPIMPPMPWQGVGAMTDADLKALYTYLQALPPVRNAVPAPVPPAEVAKLVKK